MHVSTKNPRKKTLKKYHSTLIGMKEKCCNFKDKKISKKNFAKKMIKFTPPNMIYCIIILL